jgi:predicted TIM-barrel fold metal-dependent hydrolase
VIDDVFVIDATVHNYNVHDDNIQANRWARDLREMLYQFHSKWQPSDVQVPYETYCDDWSCELFVETMFLESQTDVGGTQNLRLDSWFHDGLVSFEKNVELMERWPQRFVSYVGLDPFLGPEACIEDLERQCEQLPGAVGLKMYPDRVDPMDRWRADDPELAFPLFEKAQELGLRTVAFHKAVPNGPLPLDPYSVVDIDGAAIAFPDLSFEIVHSGMAFLDETALAIGRFPNVYANFEITSLFALVAPGMFDEIMAKLLFWGGPEKLIYSTGAMQYHPQRILEAVWNYQLSDDMRARYTLPELTRADKELFLGKNYARIVGLDIDERKAAIVDDEFATRVRDNGGLFGPYEHWKKSADVAAVGS